MSNKRLPATAYPPRLSRSVRPQIPPTVTPLTQIVQERGWARIQASADEDELLQIASGLGTIVHQTSRPQLSRLTPIASDVAAPNTASESYGTGRFPYHTDLAQWPKPPRYLIMGNAAGSSTVPTLLVDFQNLTLQAELDQKVWQALWKITKTKRPFVCGMTLTGSTTPGIRWDTNVMEPLNAPAQELTNQLTQTLEDEAIPNEIQFYWNKPGTVLVLDNWRMLHARPAVPESQKSRTLYRVFATEY